MKRLRYGCRLLAFFITLTLIIGWRKIPISLASPGDAAGYQIFLGVMFLLLNGAAACGIFMIKRWGFIVAYIAIIFTTVYYGISYVPYLVNIFHEPIRPIFLPVINLGVFLSVIYLHRLSKVVQK